MNQNTRPRCLEGHLAVKLCSSTPQKRGTGQPGKTRNNGRKTGSGDGGAGGGSILTLQIAKLDELENWQ
jgi:hypothetical protein